MSTDPTALAREVLDAAHEDETVTVCTIPDNKVATLARAVGRVAALAAKHEGTARDMGTGTLGGALAAKIAQEIRAALNGVHA